MAKKRLSKAYNFKANRYLPPEVIKVGPAAIGAAVEAAMTAEGVVDKQRLVDDAKPKAAPLHPCFEWDDPRAANLYRLYQARNIVNCVTVEIEGRETTAFPSVAVRSVDDEAPPRRENIRVEQVLSDAELRQQKINEALAKLIRVRQEYAAFQELAVVWRAIEQAEQTVG